MDTGGPAAGEPEVEVELAAPSGHVLSEAVEAREGTRLRRATRRPDEGRVAASTGRQVSTARGLNHRPLDLALALFFAITIAYGLLFSLPEGFGVPVAPDSPWPPLRSLYAWAVAQEPSHLDPPPVLIASCLFDGLFQAPVLAFVIWGLLFERGWVGPLSLVYAGAAVTNMFFYFVTTFLGPTPPPNLHVYLPFNLPWLVAPAVLGLRMLRAAPGRTGR